MVDNPCKPRYRFFAAQSNSSEDCCTSLTSGFPKVDVNGLGLRATYPCRRQHWARALIYAVCAMTSWPSMNEAFAANGMVPKAIEMALSHAIEQNIVNENYGVENRIKVASNEETVVAYFLDQLPPDSKPSELPAAARDVVIAKVRLLQSPSWNGPRHPAHPLRDVFFTQIEFWMFAVVARRSVRNTTSTSGAKRKWCIQIHRNSFLANTS
jgi:hypothetical protein